MHLGMLWVEASNQICQWLLNGMCQEIYSCHQDRMMMMLWTEVHLSFPKEDTGNHPGLKWCLLYERISIQFEEPDRHAGSWGFHLRSFFLQSNKGWTACWVVGFDGFSVSIQRIQFKLATELVQLIMLRPKASLQTVHRILWTGIFSYVLMSPLNTTLSYPWKKIRKLIVQARDYNAKYIVICNNKFFHKIIYPVHTYWNVLHSSRHRWCLQSRPDIHPGIFPESLQHPEWQLMSWV